MTNHIEKSPFQFSILNIIRFMKGFIFIPHALSKFTGWAGSVAFFTKAGFVPPEFFVCLSAGIELVAGVGLMFGILTKYASGLGACLMAVATYTVLTVNNPASFWLWNKGGVEYNTFWTILCILFFIDAWRKNPGILGIGKNIKF